MAEEEVAVAASSAPSVHKRKLEDMEAQEETEAPNAADPNDKTNSVKTAEEEEEEEEEEEDEEPVTGDDSGASDAKRLRSEPQPVGLVIENGHQVGKLDDPVDVAEQPTAENIISSEDTQEVANEAPEMVKGEQRSTDDYQTDDIQQDTVENSQMETSEQEPSGGTLQEPSSEATQQADVSFTEEQPVSGNQNMSRQMEVPNNKVGVLIGKGGETIRYLQYNSGAKIQITRDADADQSSTTRPVELIGTLESINKAEKLINDVIAEADAGGSPSLVARGFSTVQSAGAAEQLQIQVPNEKVGLIIGKGGETIKNLQTKSGARIQLIPQHLPEGDQSKERTVRVTGERKQIEMASEMIKDVMNQPVRSSSLSSGYNQQAFRPRGPSAPSHWGPRGAYPAQPTGYEHQQRGPYSSQNPQYPHPTYGNYPPQQMAPRGSFAPGWDPRPAATLQGPPPQTGGYEYYGGQGGRIADAPSSAPQSNPIHNHAPGPSVTAQANYNYGQPQGPNYGQPTPYSQSAPPSQGFGHGYGEAKYDNQAHMQHPYGGHGVAQQVSYLQGSSHPGYGPQDQYGKPPSYGMAPQGQPSQSYGQPRANLPGDASYQGSISSTQSYGPNASSQQPYPYASSGQMQQAYASYGSQPVSDGYTQPHSAASVASYPQQGSQAVSGYGQAGGQQAPGYAQVGPAGGHGAYPSSQTGYNEQPTLNNAGYAYQGATDPAYGSGPAPVYGAQPTAQPGYTQPPTQQGYDQSIPQSGGYGSIPGSVPVGYGKSLSPQPGYPQYDSTQMYGPHG